MKLWNFFSVSFSIKMMASRKKRKVVETAPVGDESPPPAGGWTPWLPSQPADHVDAPTVKLDILPAEESDIGGFSSFSQLGSVLDKLESFNKTSTSLSTMSTSVLSAIVPSSATLAMPETSSQSLTSLQGVIGIAKSITFKSRTILSVHDSYFDRFRKFVLLKCNETHVMSLASIFAESTEPCSIVIEVPGPFGVTGYISVESQPDAVLYAANVLLRDEKKFADESESFGIKIERLAIATAQESGEEENENHESKSSDECIVKITGKRDIFGFFDYFKQSELITNSWRKPVSIFASFPFKDAVCVEAKLSRVTRSAIDNNIRVVTVEDVMMPLSQVDRLVSGQTCSVITVGPQFDSLNAGLISPYLVNNQLI
jgi:hypothetical protein